MPERKGRDDLEAEIVRLQRRFAPHAGDPRMEAIRERAHAWLVGRLGGGTPRDGGGAEAGA